MENYNECIYHYKRDPIQSAVETEAKAMIYALVGERRRNNGDNGNNGIAGQKKFCKGNDS